MSVEKKGSGVPARFCTEEERIRRIPVHVVWELTLACDLKCRHCGSRAGARRPAELSTQECLEIVDSLAALGTREISLIGGEAYLRKDLAQIIQHIRSYEIYCAIQTGGRNFKPYRLAAAVAAGLNGLGVSLDGLESLHDELRGVEGSFRSALDTLERARSAGLCTSVSTQIGSKTIGDLPGLLDVIADAGARHWQVQLSVPIGNAADHDDLILQPYQLAEVMPVLARLYQQGLDRDVLMIVGNNVGFFGPFEHLWRGLGDDGKYWTGCSAGELVLALESDGTVKGCPSLPTCDYAGGNVRRLPLDAIWRNSPRIDFARGSSVQMLWGYCRTCYYADVCGGGCTWMAHSLFGRPGNNPYCHYRVLELEKQGIRERIRKIEHAVPEPFAVAKFELVFEAVDGTGIRSGSRQQLINIGPPPRPAIVGDRGSPTLRLCRNCNSYVRFEDDNCPHCGGNIAVAAKEYQAEQDKRRIAMEEVRGLIVKHLALTDCQGDKAKELVEIDGHK